MGEFEIIRDLALDFCSLPIVTQLGLIFQRSVLKLHYQQGIHRKNDKSQLSQNVIPLVLRCLENMMLGGSEFTKSWVPSGTLHILICSIPKVNISTRFLTIHNPDLGCIGNVRYLHLTYKLLEAVEH